MLVTDPYYRRIAFNSLWFAAATTIAAVAVAVPVAHALAKYDLPGERAFVTVISFPNSLPGIVAAFMIIVLFGNTGVLTNFSASSRANRRPPLRSRRAFSGSSSRISTP